MAKVMVKQTVCIDFDGVLNTYDGWRGEDELFTPREGVEEFLTALSNQYKVVIHTTRGSERVFHWLRQHNLHSYVARITNEKEAAVAYIDDRALCFRGDYADTLYALANFKPHWQREGK